MNIKLKPEILTQPNVPKPLHGICPRTIKGEAWWNKTRQEVYASTDYHCVACGIHKSEAKEHQWLEAHEFWVINYQIGVCEIKSIEPLCHYCHNFIHSGRLKVTATKEKAKNILEHGFKILSDNKLECFEGTLNFAKEIDANTYNVKDYKIKLGAIGWNDFKLMFEGKEYKSKFKSYAEWQDFYQKQENKND